MNELRKFQVTLERDETGFIVVECPDLPGCMSQGRTEAEALANIREAIEASLETRREHGI
jgi:predicted RNase H-like HicB family nuclease